MNKENKLRELWSLFSRFKYHEAVPEEIYDLVVRTGRAKEFTNLFAKAVRQLEILGQDVIKLKQFEKLKGKGTNNLYSLHIEGKNLNIRILYSYGQNSEILLHCFYEKDDSKKGSYEAHIPIAIKRMKEMEAQNG